MPALLPLRLQSVALMKTITTVQPNLKMALVIPHCIPPCSVEFLELEKITRPGKSFMFFSSII